MGGAHWLRSYNIGYKPLISDAPVSSERWWVTHVGFSTSIVLALANAVLDGPDEMTLNLQRHFNGTQTALIVRDKNLN